MPASKTVFFIIGILLTILGISMLVPYGLQVYYGEDSHSFISSSFITIFFGALLSLSNIEKEYKLNLQQTFLFTSMAWFMIALFGSIPFMLSPTLFIIQ